MHKYTVTTKPQGHTLDDCIWITWEKQRRTETLAKRMEVPLYRLNHPNNYYLKLLILSFQTIIILLKIRPRVLIVQNPSMALTSLVIILKPFFRYKVIVDRHSNFKFHTINKPSPKYKLFHRLSRYTVRNANLTIVTNEFLAKVVEDWGGNPFILQDMLPSLPLAKRISLEGEQNLAFVTSFSDDEPIKEVLQAAQSLPSEVILYITGNWKRWREVKSGSLLLNEIPRQVRLTGYLDEKEFQILLKSVDAIIALTTQDHTLLCGAYEAISLEKPLLTSDTTALKSYFRKGVLFTKHDINSLTHGLRAILNDPKKRSKKIKELKITLTGEWETKFNNLILQIKSL